MSEPKPLSIILRDAAMPADGRIAQFEVTRVIGQGGMGIVVAAIDHRLQREVAIKLMRPELARSEAARQMFVTEARAMAALRHDNVVPVYEVGEVRQVPFLAMELLKGETIQSLLERGFDFSDQQIAKLGYQVAAGLHAAHKEGIVHRDVKPGNIFLELPRGRVKVLDFGLARSASAADVADSLLVGTPGYLSPEQARDDKVDVRSDLFSLGVVLYRMAAGRLPWAATDAAEMLVKLLTETPTSLRQLRPDLPVELTEIVDRCLESRPGSRPDSAADVGRALKEAHRAMVGTKDSSVNLIVSEVSVAETLKQRQRAASGPTSRGKLLATIGITVFSALLLAVLAYTLNGLSNGTEESDSPEVATSNGKAGDEPEEFIDGAFNNGGANPEPDVFDLAKSNTAGAHSEWADRIPPERPADNIPDALRKFDVFDNLGPRGADCYVTRGTEADVGKEPFLLVAGRKDKPEQKVFIRFDISGRQKDRQIKSAFLLMTMKREGVQPDTKVEFRVSVLREDSPKSEWAESGPRRIVFSDNPVQVYSADTTYTGVMSERYSCWYQPKHDSIMMFQHQTGPMTMAIRRDQDGLLTVIIAADNGQLPPLQFVSREGPKGFGPKLVLQYD